MNELKAWLAAEDDEIPWAETEEQKTPFYADKSNMTIERFLEHKGVQHLRQILEIVDNLPKAKHKNSRPAERE